MTSGGTITHVLCSNSTSTCLRAPSLFPCASAREWLRGCAPLDVFTGKQAIDLAKSEEPHNIHVQKVQHDGMPVNLIHRETPEDICRFRKNKANNFQDGGGQNVFDVLREVPLAADSWAAYRQTERISAKTSKRFTYMTRQRECFRQNELELRYVFMFRVSAGRAHAESKSCC